MIAASSAHCTVTNLDRAEEWYIRLVGREPDCRRPDAGIARVAPARQHRRNTGVVCIRSRRALLSCARRNGRDAAAARLVADKRSSLVPGADAVSRR